MRARQCPGAPIDLNADLGEGGTRRRRAPDRVVTSANVACGFHAGDETTMRAACRDGRRARASRSARTSATATATDSAGGRWPSRRRVIEVEAAEQIGALRRRAQRGKARR